ncbi:dipeptide ABC transporter ATP-binding protein [Micromonospora sp. DT228]|uniref:ABC transporter ATP-binding protein n=1 Tax=Micromonospora sp. DT228 TaxID=3393443 RepID=UPI003CFB7B94
MSDVVLEVDGLSVTFPNEHGAVEVVRGIGYELRAGEVLGIVGESGSGKSASALAVMGLLPNHARVSGSVRFRGAELLTMSDRRASAIRGSRIGMIFQDPFSALTPVYRIGDQIAEALRVHRDISKRRAAERAVELLDLVGVPDPRRRALAFPHELSGGMLQRVMIAIAVANDPDVIIADEPTTALDVTAQAQILDVLRTAREVTGAAVVVITHDLGVVAGLADRVQVMYAGKLVESAPVEELFEHPRMPYTIGLLDSLPSLDDDRRRSLSPIAGTPPPPGRPPPGCAFRPRCALVIDICAERVPDLRRPLGAGRSHHAACHRSDETDRDRPAVAASDATGAAPEPRRKTQVLRVDGLVKWHVPRTDGLFRRRSAAVPAVDGISFDVREGETVALVGESGCGKTTTLLEILELRRPQHGRIEVFGRDTASMTGAERFTLRREVQILFQDPVGSLDPRMPVGDILGEPLLTHGVSRDERHRRVREVLALVGLASDHVDRYPHEFSGGERQRIGIARALALRPRLLVLDEPVSALDVSIRAGIVNLLASLRDELGMSYLVVSHDLSMVRHLADRVAVMYLGRIMEIGPAAAVFVAPRHPYTQALLSAIPLPDPRRERARERVLLRGDPPVPGGPASGCRFRTRCQLFPELGDDKRRRCLAEDPSPAGSDDHHTACHFPVPLRVL